ncbi:hypothetical protein [Brevundimonas bullata]|uniref:hypothetical protein n=1 Tax=Brevundimonas bullata TaxID=13160 RepID=UPI003D9AB182
MTAITPVERVCEALAKAGYVKLDRPLTIATLTIDLPAAFLGADTSPDLIVVGDLAEDSSERLQQKVETVARALDAMRSVRPLTVIVVGPRPSPASLLVMAQVARVLPVGMADEAQLKNWLAVLLPLDLPDPREGFVDIDKALGVNDVPDEASVLRAAALNGEAEVLQAFVGLISSPFEAVAGNEEVPS